MANPDNPYTMGGFLRSRMQQGEPAPQQQSVVPSREPLPPVQKGPDQQRTQQNTRPSALDLIGTSLTSAAVLLAYAPASIAAKSKGEPLPRAIADIYENLDDKLNRGNPDSLLVKGLKKYWGTPAPKEREYGKPDPEPTRRPIPSVGVESPEERMARQTSQQRGDFDATPPVEEGVLRRDRSYSQIGYNTLFVPKPTDSPQPQTAPQPRRFTNNDAKYLAAHGLYLGIDPRSGEFIRLDKPTDHTKSRPLNQQEIQYIYDALGPVDLRPRKTKQNRTQPVSVEQLPPRNLTPEDLKALEQQGITLIPDRGIIYVDPTGKRRIRKITPEEKAWIIDYLGNVDLGSIVEEASAQQPKRAKRYSKIEIVTSVQGKK